MRKKKNLKHLERKHIFCLKKKKRNDKLYKHRDSQEMWKDSKIISGKDWEKMTLNFEFVFNNIIFQTTSQQQNIDLKMCKWLNSHVSKADTEMINKNTKRYSTSLIIRKCESYAQVYSTSCLLIESESPSVVSDPLRCHGL